MDTQTVSASSTSPAVEDAVLLRQVQLAYVQDMLHTADAAQRAATQVREEQSSEEAAAVLRTLENDISAA